VVDLESPVELYRAGRGGRGRQEEEGGCFRFFLFVEAVVGAGDTIDCELPHTDDSEKISEPNVDVVEDVTDPPVDEVANEVSRLSHLV